MVTSSYLLILIIFFIPFAFVSSTSLNSKFVCDKNDSKVLLRLKKSFNSSSTLSSWKESTNCCQWQGIECEPYAEGRVTKLTLRFTDISGTISSSIGKLSELNELTIAVNQNLTGTIPASIGNLKNLTYLDISSNSLLEGHIPTTLCKLSRLENLYLSGNDLTGKIPGCLGGKLVNIFLGMNRLSGSIPASFLSRRTRNDTLLNLDVNSNNLTGAIPASINNIKYINVGANQFTDVSALFGEKKKFAYMTLSYNKLAFNLSDVRFPSNLVQLQLDHNMVYGSFPKQIKDLIKLVFLHVNDNRLSGAIPQELMELPKLQEFVANNNNFSGEIPQQMTKQLSYFVVSKNKLSGMIPKQFTELPLLYYLDVSYNELCGPIPSGGPKKIFTKEAFSHNKCLCGAPLQPCP